MSIEKQVTYLEETRGHIAQARRSLGNARQLTSGGAPELEVYADMLVALANGVHRTRVRMSHARRLELASLELSKGAPSGDGRKSNSDKAGGRGPKTGV